MPKPQFILPRDRESVRLFATGMAFYLALMEYVREEPKTIQELEERTARAYTLLEKHAAKAGQRLSNGRDTQVRALIEESFPWAYQYATRELDSGQVVWIEAREFTRSTSSTVALDAIFAQLREQWDEVSRTLPRVVAEEEESICVFEGCQEKGRVVRTVTLKSKNDIPFEFQLTACDTHYEAIAVIAHDNGRIQSLLERVAPDIFLTKKIVSARKEKLLIDRFRIAQRWDETNTEYQAIQEHFGERGVQFALAFIDAYVDIARKYELTPSAAVFAMSLPTIPFSRAIAEAVDFDERVFFTFQEPVETPYGLCYGFSFGIKSLENVRYANRIVPLPPGQFEKMRKMMLDETVLTVGLDAFTESGLAIWTLSFYIPKDIETETPAQPMHFMTQSWQRCQSGECGNGKPICASCMAVNEWYYSLYANVLRMIGGDYAMEEEVRPEQEVRTAISKRKQPDQHKYWKMRDVEVPYEYRVVSMDALLKKSSPVREGSISRGSWMARLDPEQIVYVKKRIVLRKGRTLRDPRYHKYILAHGGSLEEGYTISVKDHEKRVPMKYETLTKLIERVEVKGPTFLKK